MNHRTFLATARLRRIHLASVSVLALGLFPAIAVHAAPGNTVISTAVTGPENWNGGDFTVTSTGSITGGGTGVIADPSGDTFSNSGTISGDTTGIYNEGTIGSVSNDGTIQGGGVGFDNDGLITTFTNLADGVITTTGAHSAGLQNTGTITSLINAGSIYADPTGMNGIYNPVGGTIGSITNSGTIKGSLYAISSDGTLGPIENSGLIAGNIKNLGAAADLIINGGTSVMGTITGYDEVSVGAINGGTRDVVFNSGKLLLNSHITVTGHSVRNTGADLRVDNEITVTGNYVQTGGSLISGVNSSSNYGSLTVTGNASLSDTALVLFDIGGNMATGQTYTILNAGGTLTATNLTSSNSGFETTYEASGQNLIVTLGNAIGGSSADYYTLGNEVNPFVGQMGLFIDVISVSNHPDAVRFQTNVLPAINALTDAQKKQVLFDVALGWMIFGGTNGMSAQNFIGALLSFRITNHQGTLKYASNGSSGIAAGDEVTSGAMWGQIIGGTTNRDSSSGAIGFDATSYGMVVGADFDVTDELTGGVALGWVHSSSNMAIGDAGSDIDTYQAALYGTWTPKSLGGRLNIDGQLGFGYNDYEQSRVIHAFGLRAAADYVGWQTFADVVAGYDFPLDGNLVLTPYMGLRAVHFSNDGYTEKGAGLLNVTVDDYSDNSVQHDIGVKIATSFDSSLGKVSPTLKLGWLHDYGGSPASVSGSMAGVTFSAPMSAVSENGLAIGAALDITRSDTLTLGFDYNGDLRSDYQSHTASLKATIRF
tara:strand:- start:46752 stop:49052 length:2301 start_codon:yes stop_codon:yes gene_type:complete